MTTRHLFHHSQSLVNSSLYSSTILNPSLGYNPEYKSVYRKYSQTRLNGRKVILIAGGGAGHEPAHGGYVGVGMLDGGVSGDIFASPSAKQIEMCARLALAPEGIDEDEDAQRGEQQLLVIINNYTGDILNFGLAIERIKSPAWLARGYPVTVETVVVADDVSVGRAQGGKVGRRGLAGNILVCKILGAGAEKGLKVHQLKHLGDATVANLASIGLSLDHCHVPGRSVNHADSLPPQASSLGMGLHNEPGVRILDPTPTPEQTIKEMLDLIFDTNADRNFASFKPGDRVLVFINNLGGMSILEMGGIVTEAVKQLEKDRGIRPERVLCSSYMTSLNGPGFSISLLNVGLVEERYKSVNGDEVDVLELVDLPTDAAAWQGSTANNWRIRPEDRLQSNPPLTKGETLTKASSNPTVTQSSIQAITRACRSVVAAEDAMTRFDTIVGDGDCGATWANGAQGILRAIDTGNLDLSSNAEMIESLARIVEDKTGGTSGALLALLLTSMSRAFATATGSDPNPWPKAAQFALTTLSNYTPAKPGDRTLIDSLHPFIDSLGHSGNSEEAAEACKAGALNTRHMKPKLGRSVYVGGGDSEPWRGVPDPGAWGVLAVVSGLVGVEMPATS